MGPSAIRIAHLERRLQELGHRVEDHGNVSAADMSTASVGDPKARYLDHIVTQCRGIADLVTACVKGGSFPLVLGGDQSTSIGTLAGLSRSGTRRGIVWVDAHGDYNTPRTTLSGNVHGMALASILGYGDPRLSKLGAKTPMALEKNTVLIGGRSFDPLEAKAIGRSKMRVFTMREIDELGIRRVVKEAIRVAGAGVDDVHLSFDVDSMDPKEAPGTGTPVNGGLTYREAHLLMEMLSDSGKVTSAEFVEVNPILDTANHTAELAVELILSLFGKKIIA